ncbi:MAG: hypothetical protein ACTSYI_13025 [Promethearchaeota archaeon]
MDFLKEDLEAADDEVEEFESKVQQYEVGKALLFTNAVLKTKIKEIIDSALHNINLTAPTIQDVGDLYLFEVNANVNVKVACNISMGEKSHQEIVEELEAFDNIDIRIYDGNDRWSLIVDGNKLIFGALGTKPDEILVFQTEDPKQVNLFNNMAMESWLRGKKLRD